MQGGMALPNVLIYYWAANIKSLLFWLWDTSTLAIPALLQIESSSSSRISLFLFSVDSLAYTPDLLQPCAATGNFTIRGSN